MIHLRLGGSVKTAQAVGNLMWKVYDKYFKYAFLGVFFFFTFVFFNTT